MRIFAPLGNIVDWFARLGGTWPLLGACLSLSILSIWLIFVGIAYETYQTAWHDADLFATDVATLLEQGISRDIEVYDLSLQAVAKNASRADIVTLAPALQRLVLFDQSSNASGMGAMLLTDRAGNVILESKRTSPPPLNLADRLYFIAQRDGTPEAQPFVSHPLRSRVSQALSIVLSRPRLSPSGVFDGVVCGTISVDYINALFASLPLPPGSVITLMHRDGTILAREPQIGADIGSGLKAPILFEAVNSGKQGPIVLRSYIDGTERLVAFHKAGALPIYLSVGLSTKEFLGKWRWRLEMIAAGFLVLSAIILFLGVMLVRELNRRTLAEDALSTLAATDSLTMLANRRRFDETLEIEWRRAIRDVTPLSLLMIDGDSFKAFNDTYGHIEGDRALRQIADALRGAVQRPGDLVARFGGEEFVVLLPATDRAGARQVAETIRRAILDLAVPHAGSPLGILTLSIGVACRRPHLQDNVGTLVEAADIALYAAKAKGRGRIVAEECGERMGGSVRELASL